jgi:hypothetical protein
MNDLKNAIQKVLVEILAVNISKINPAVFSIYALMVVNPPGSVLQDQGPLREQSHKNNTTIPIVCGGSCRYPTQPAL